MRALALKFDPPPESAAVGAAEEPALPTPEETEETERSAEAAPAGARPASAAVVSLDAFRKKNG